MTIEVLLTPVAWLRVINMLGAMNRSAVIERTAITPCNGRFKRFIS